MKKVCVVGHFGFGENMLNGQTIKTKTVTTELEKQLGADQVMKIDTHGGAKALPKIIFQLINAFKNCNNIIIFPAHNGVKVFVPLCNAINKVFHRKLHYVVIGGWLPSFLKDKDRLRKSVSQFTGVYVETTTMQNALKEIGIINTYLLKNFKDINVISESELKYQHERPYKICTFSRVMKEKGIEDIVNAVININTSHNEEIYQLDIYGQVDSEQGEWFEQLSRNFPSYISYKGLVQFDKSVEVLKDYFMLVFPTKFYTEDIPGTIIDAYAAGLPVLSSKWESFSDVIDEGVTGIGYDFDDVVELKKLLLDFSIVPHKILSMKSDCLEKTKEYIPENAIQPLMYKLY